MNQCSVTPVVQTHRRIVRVDLPTGFDLAREVDLDLEPDYSDPDWDNVSAFGAALRAIGASNRDGPWPVGPSGPAWVAYTFDDDPRTDVELCESLKTVIETHGLVVRSK